MKRQRLLRERFVSLVQMHLVSIKRVSFTRKGQFMTGTAKLMALAVLLAGVCCDSAVAQVAPVTILDISIENGVDYRTDVTDYSRLATDPNITTAIIARNFSTFISLADIVAVNGKPAKGTLVRRGTVVNVNPNPTPGQALADTQRAFLQDDAWEILQADGTPIGTIFVSFLAGGTPPPGAPLISFNNNGAITGGTGAFFGARGQATNTADRVANRTASVTEDPGSRRRNGGGRAHFIFQLIPLSTPQIVITPGGPAVTHSNDFALVSASRPAAAGEVLSLFATGLGPTRPGVDPGKPFPASPLAAVNSPVEVTVNGRAAEVLAAVGYPGAVDGYQVNFRVPPDAAKGTATVQVSAAFIAGSEVRITIQ